MPISVGKKQINDLSQGGWVCAEASYGKALVYKKDVVLEYPYNDSAVFIFDVTEEFVGQEFNLWMWTSNSGSSKNYNIDWGDGTIDKDIFDLIGSAPHIYTKPGIYTCSIYDGYTGFYGMNYDPLSTDGVFQTLIKFVIQGKSPFEYINILRPSLIYCPKLEYFDFTNLFNNSDLFLQQGPSVCSGAFRGSKMKNSITTTFYHYLESWNSEYSYMFADSPNIPSIDSNIGMAITNSSEINLSYMFQNCTGITGKLPELWKTHGNTIHEGCFNGCVNASNYSEVPSDWK